MRPLKWKKKKITEKNRYGPALSFIDGGVPQAIGEEAGTACWPLRNQGSLASNTPESFDLHLHVFSAI